MTRALNQPRVEDIEANRFAMELLMPAELLIADVLELGGIDVESDSNIKQLARRYGVSEQLMMFRLGSLGLVL